MTTKVTVTCPEGSHWNLKVIGQTMTVDGWADSDDRVIKPTESYDTHVYDTRRVVVEEADRAS